MRFGNFHIGFLPREKKPEPKRSAACITPEVKQGVHWHTKLELALFRNSNTSAPRTIEQCTWQAQRIQDVHDDLKVTMRRILEKIEF